MRRWQSFSLALAVVVPVAAGQVRKAQPVGLVLGAGSTVARAGSPAVAVKAGEVLFAGDVLRAAAGALPFLFCPEKFSAALSGGGEAALGDAAVEVKSGSLGNRKTVASCFLPEVQKLSLASQQHYGVMLTRAGSQPPPTTTFHQRMSALPDDKRHALEASLGAAQGDEAEILVQRAAALERAGLWYDAGEAYRKAGEQWPEVAWIKRKVTEIENILLKEQSR